MRRNASTYADVLAGEAAFAHGEDARFEDMKHIASVIENRARALGVPVEDVFSRRSEFNAYGTRLPAGIGQKHLDMADRAIREVREKGPVTTATFYATPAAQGNLPRGLQRVGQTKGHVYFTDPKKRGINTRKGTRPANYDAIARAPLAPLKNTKADQRLADAWGYQDPNAVRGLTTPRGAPVPTLKDPPIDATAVRRGLPTPAAAPRPTIDGVQVARGLPAPTPAFRGIELSAAPVSFPAAAPVRSVAPSPIPSTEYDPPAMPTPRSTVAGRAGVPAPMAAPRDAMLAERGPRVAPTRPAPTLGAPMGSIFADGAPRLSPDARVAGAFEDASRFVDLNERYPSTLYDPGKPKAAAAAPRGAPQLAAPVQAGFSPPASVRQAGPDAPVQAAAATPARAAPERLAGFPTPTQRGIPKGAPQPAAEKVPDLTSSVLPGAAPVAGRPGIPSFGGPFSSLAAAAPQAPVGVAGEQRVQPAASPPAARPAATVADRMAVGPQRPAIPASAPIPTTAPRQAPATASVSAPRQAAPAPAAPASAPRAASVPASAPRTAAPAVPAAPRAPAPDVTPYRSAPAAAGSPPRQAGAPNALADTVREYAPGMIGGMLGGAVLGPIGAIAGSYLANKAFGGGGNRALGDGVTTGLLTGRAIPADVLRDPNRYGQGGFTGVGLPSAPRAPSQSQSLKSRDRRGGRGDSGPSMSKEASDAIGKAGAGRGGLW